MKKMFTLLTGLLLAIAVMAADRRPMVTVNSMKSYKVVIDGRSFFTGNNTISIDNLHLGRHSIEVYEMKRGYNQRREKLVASSSFHVDNRDIKIMIDHNGNIRIDEKKRYGRYERNDRDDNRDWNDRNERDRSDRDERDWDDQDWKDRNDRNERDRDDKDWKDRSDKHDRKNKDWKDKCDKHDRKNKDNRNRRH